MSEMKWCANNMQKTKCDELELMSLSEMEKVMTFHKSFPQYEETPLVSLKALSKELGVSGLYVKDESFRFGLNAFKVLGGSYAMAKFIAQKLEIDISELPYSKLTSDEVKNKIGDTVFYTATDGNHGRGVAWAAKELKQKAVVYMPDGSSLIRRDRIREEGAVCEIIEGMNYDACVRLASKEAAEKSNSVVVQDTAWDGYEEIPGWIMQGYGTMGLEAINQLKELGIERPTHIFVQAGVGSLPGAVVGCFKNMFPENCPTIIVVEPNAADCIYKSAVSGKREIVTGDMKTIMAGLACGEPNTISWEILKNHAAFFVSCPDWISAKGMRMLAAPMGDDKKVVSGESGAVGLGLLAALMTRDELQELKNALKLDKDSKVLFFSSEGDTDPEKYKSIVWDGEVSEF